MKIEMKTPKEILLETHQKVNELEVFAEDMILLLKKRDIDLAETKKDFLGQINDLIKQIAQRDTIIKNQAVMLKEIALSLKNGSGKSTAGLKEKDIKYIVKLINDNNTIKVKKQGFFRQMFGGE